MIVPQHVQPYRWPLFYGEILVGEPEQDRIEVIFDTGSDWLSVPSVNCDRCIGGSYLTTDEKRVDFLDNTRAYGDNDVLKGFTYKDKVCIDTEPQSCVPKFEFFAFDSVEGDLEFPFGVMGLS